MSKTPEIMWVASILKREVEVEVSPFKLSRKMSLVNEEEGLTGFLPVYSTREAALEAAGEDGDVIKIVPRTGGRGG